MEAIEAARAGFVIGILVGAGAMTLLHQAIAYNWRGRVSPPDPRWQRDSVNLHLATHPHRTERRETK